MVKVTGDEVLSGSAVVAGTGRVRITKVGAENYAVQPRRGGPPVHPRELAAAQRHQPHRHVGRHHDRARRHPAREQPVLAARRGLAGSRHQHGRRARRHGARRTRAAHQRRLRRRRRPPRRQAVPGAGAAGDRGARPRRRAVRRQDRHHHRGLDGPRRGRGAPPSDAASPVDAATSTTPSPRWRGSTPIPTPRCTRSSTTTRRRPTGRSCRARAVLVGTQVERDDLRRPRHLGARRPGERARRRLRGASCASRSNARRPTAGECSCSPPPSVEPTPRRSLDVRPVALVLLEDVVRADAPETLQYFADQGVTLKVISRRQQRHRRRGRPPRRARALAGQRQRPGRSPTSTTPPPPPSSPTPSSARRCSVASPRTRSGRWSPALQARRPRRRDDRRRRQRRARAEGRRLRHRDGIRQRGHARRRPARAARLQLLRAAGRGRPRAGGSSTTSSEWRACSSPRPPTR